MHEINKILEDVIGIIRKAGQVALSYYNKEYTIRNKGDNSPVTEADLASEKIILAGLEKYNYGILSEETNDDKSRLNKKRVWIIDPLDGTKDFIDKTGDYTIMIGLAESGTPILGVVYAPADDTLYYAHKNQGAYKVVGEGKPVKLCVSKRDDLTGAMLVTSRFHHSDREKALIKNYRVSSVIKGSSLKACMVAEGRADINFNPADKTWEWDVCASDIILKEAGGKMTDTRGREFIYNKENPRNEYGYVATNGLIHEQIVSVI